MGGLITAAVTRLKLALAAAAGSSLVGYMAAGVGALLRSVLSKLRESVSIDDYPDLATALAALGGAEGTGYGAAPVNLDLLGKVIVLAGAGTIYLPTNVSLINGEVVSVAGQVVQRNPHLANTALRGNTLYWAFMSARHRNVKFNCKFIISGYIGGAWDYCDFTGANSALIFVNCGLLWTEYNTFFRCTMAGNAGVGAGTLFDGNLSNTSAYAVGAGAGAPDGSFGYNAFIQCKGDTTAPTVLMKVRDGGTWYNGKAEFRGYARGAGGAFIYVEGGANPGTISYCEFALHLESFNAASNIISVEDGGRFWNNTGTIQSASPTMTFSQGAAASIRTNKILVTGAVLLDKAAAQVFQGDQAQSLIVNHLQKRLTYVKDDTEFVDKLVAGTSIASPSVIATTALESQVQYTGAIISRPNDIRSANARNYAWMAQGTVFGSYDLKVSTTNLNDPTVTVLSVLPAGVKVVAGFGCNGKTPQAAVASGGTLDGVIAALVANGILAS